MRLDNRVLGNSKPKNSWQDLTISILPVLKSFIKNWLIVKSSETIWDIRVHKLPGHRVSWLLNTCLPTANPFPASLVVATSDRLTVVISISHVWNLLRTEDVHLHNLHTPALQIGTHFLLTLKTVVFLFHLLSATSKPFSSLSTRIARAVTQRLWLYYKNALYKFTVIITIGLLGEITHAYKRMNPIHFGRDPADIWIRINSDSNPWSDFGFGGVCALWVFLF